jgi:alpha-tubulin suppressor-like RCC1 family protein
VPTVVSGGHLFQVVTAGGFIHGHTCGLTSTAVAFCWGHNERGQLGIGMADLAEHSTPAPVSGGLTLTALTVGLGSHTCGLIGSGAAYCWGANTFGGLGNGSVVDSPIPTAVGGGLAFAHLRAGGFIGHTCGLTTSGAAFCWGENERGQVGDGSTIDRLAPARVGGLTFIDLDAGFRHTCGRASGGAVYCWGSGAAGQLGTNSILQSAVPAKVLGQP